MSLQQPKPLFGSSYDNTDINSLPNEECQPIFNPNSGNLLNNNNLSIKHDKNGFISNTNDYHKLDPIEYGINSSAYASAKQFCLSYTIKQTIGKGNFSVVKLATHTVTGQPVAIKIIDKNKLSSDNLEKVYREIKVMKKLNHKNIVNLYQVFDSKNLIYIIMEYVPHGELFDFINEFGPMNEKKSRIIFLGILSAVEHCHLNHVVHRDLKAENLLLDDKMNIKLADFGFSTFNTCHQENHSSEKLLLTWCGSPPYAAPEIFKGDPYEGTKADIWSLGVVLYVMVCGNLPFDGQTLPELKNQVIRGKFQIPFWLSHECENLIIKMLSKSPSKRPTIKQIRSHPWFTMLKKSLSNDENLSGLKPSNSNNSVKQMANSVHNSLSNSSHANSGSDKSLSRDSQISSSDSSDDFRDGKFNEVALDIMDNSGIARNKVLDSLNARSYDHLTAIYLLLCQKLKSLDHIPQNGQSNLLTTGKILSTLSLNQSPKSNYVFNKSHTPVILEKSTTSLDYKPALTPITQIKSRENEKPHNYRRRPLSQVAPKTSKNDRVIKIYGNSIKHEDVMKRNERTITPDVVQNKEARNKQIFLNQINNKKISREETAFFSMKSGRKMFLPIITTNTTSKSRLSPYENDEYTAESGDSCKSPTLQRSTAGGEEVTHFNSSSEQESSNGFNKCSKTSKSPTEERQDLKRITIRPFTTIKTIPQWVVRNQTEASSRKSYQPQNHIQNQVYSTSAVNGNGPVIIVNAGGLQNYSTTQS